MWPFGIGGVCQSGPQGNDPRVGNTGDKFWSVYLERSNSGHWLVTDWGLPQSASVHTSEQGLSQTTSGRWDAPPSQVGRRSVCQDGPGSSSSTASTVKASMTARITCWTILGSRPSYIAAFSSDRGTWRKSTLSGTRSPLMRSHRRIVRTHSDAALMPAPYRRLLAISRLRSREEWDRVCEDRRRPR